MHTLYTKEQIKKRIQELAKGITVDYQNQPLHLISILKGSLLFSADMLRALYEAGKTDVSIDFMQVSSYGSAKQTSKKPTIVSDITTDISNKHVLIVDDILDTGYTLQFVKTHLQTQNPASLKLLVLLDKTAKREADIQADYVGFTIHSSPWVEGYGLDTDGLGRGNPDIIDKS